MKALKSLRPRQILIVLLIVLATWAFTRVVWVSAEDMGVMWVGTETSEDSATFRGAWRMSNDTQGFMSQTVLSCRKSVQECVLAGMPLQHDGGWTSQMNVEYYKITSWGEDGLLRAESDSECANTVITANIGDATARAVSTWKTGKVEECGQADEAATEWVLESKEPSFLGDLAEELDQLLYIR